MTSQVAERKPTRPRARHGLIVRKDSAPGVYVVKDTSTGDFFHLGEQEHYLLSQFDGRQEPTEICSAFEARFREPLSTVDLQDFVELVSRRGLLDEPEMKDDDSARTVSHEKSKARTRSAKGSLLHWRIPVLDPDAILDRLVPWLSFLWTRTFVLVCMGMIAAAAAIAFANQTQWLSSFPQSITWQSIAAVWILIFLITVFHEFAHGLTCKHYGGEVHEMGFLLLFFMPCFYCNVSDAWLFGDRGKRLWVGAAGAWSDLVMWAAATILWRVTAPETSLNYFAWVTATVCGGRCIFNCNPLIKLDGYYLLSDILQIPNLYDRGRKRFLETTRWLLWGARRPNSEPKSGWLFCYGMASWLFLASLLWGMVYGLLQLRDFTDDKLRPVAATFAVLMPVLIGKNLTSGLSAGEFTKMFSKRKGRAFVWLLGLVGLPGIATVIPFEDRVTGHFTVRPTTRVEINALESGFLKEIHVSEGTQVSAGSIIARIEIPDLEVNQTKKRAEIRECEANLRRVTAGPRSEAVGEQRARVNRVMQWVELGKSELQRSCRVLTEELGQIDQEILQCEAELEFRQLSLAHAEKLHSKKALSGEQLASEKTACKIASLKLAHARAKKRSREAEGTIDAESELARREKELADEQSQLKLLEAGGRTEDVEAEQARLARLKEELRHLEHLQSRVVLRSPVAGIVTTPRMHEKVGQHVPTGTVICVIEDLNDIAAEIGVSESSVLKVKPGQFVELRARGLPMETFQARVRSTSHVAVASDSPANVKTPTPQRAVLPGQVTVYCELSQTDAQLLSGMTGYARIYSGRKTLAGFLLNKFVPYLRTEFWFW